MSRPVPRHRRKGHRRTGPVLRRLTVASALVTGACTGAAESCRIAPAARVHFETVGNFVLVPVAIEGVPMVMDLDTGATGIATISGKAAARLNLAPRPDLHPTVTGFTGTLEIGMTRPVTLTLGDVSASYPIFITPGGWAPPVPGRQVDGLLQAGFLSYWDVELDFAAHEMTLYRVAGCAGHFIPWKGPYDGFAAARNPPDMLIVPVEVNGQPLKAIVDTGANLTTLTARGAAKLGLPQETLGLGHSLTVIGYGGRSVDASVVRGLEVKLGQHVWRNVSLPVVETPIDVADMLLGFDFWQSRHVWLSYGTSQVFLAR